MWKSLFAANAENAEKALMGIAPAKDLSNISSTSLSGKLSERDELTKLSFDQMDRGNKLEHVRAQYYDLYEAKFEEKFGKKPAK